MIDATDIKAHPTTSGLTQQGGPPDWWHHGGHDQQAPWGLPQQSPPLRLHLREGQCSDFTGADGVLKDLPPVAAVMGDQEYDSNKICKMLSQQGIPPCIPPRRCRKKPVHYSKSLDRRHHKIENLFSRQKDWRRLATRYHSCAHLFRSAILLAADLFW